MYCDVSVVVVVVVARGRVCAVAALPPCSTVKQVYRMLPRGMALLYTLMARPTFIVSYFQLDVFVHLIYCCFTMDGVVKKIKCDGNNVFFLGKYCTRMSSRLNTPLRKCARGQIAPPWQYHRAHADMTMTLFPDAELAAITASDPRYVSIGARY